VLGVREIPGDPLAGTLAAALQPRELLLILDNCEHILDGCVQLGSSLLAACPRLRALCTGREVLGLAEEMVKGLLDGSFEDWRGRASWRRR
jgi:predicted ATPase